MFRVSKYPMMTLNWCMHTPVSSIYLESRNKLVVSDNVAGDFKLVQLAEGNDVHMFHITGRYLTTRTMSEMLHTKLCHESILHLHVMSLPSCWMTLKKIPHSIPCVYSPPWNSMCTTSMYISPSTAKNYQQQFCLYHN